ncbi:Serine/Threonine protein kinase with TPR repeats [Calothrix sp. PCC 7716]|nr:Serine/Threonine protein kinase with TPR repeats [Calothrix sp. PCC 7716]
MSGKILNSRYELDQKLGGGGLGDTYLAFDLWKEDDNRCVVKQLRPGIVNATTLRLFEKEAEALSKLGSHDQIPTLWAHFQQDNQFYLVQEFIEGHDLTQEIKLGECWQETDVIKLLQDILEVLDFVHQNNVIHRDIKPGNIMRRQDGKIVLIDFGGVKQVKNNPTSRQSSVVIGTPGYMPYEQIYNNAQFCSDIYAVGMLAIGALIGENPVDIPTDSKTLQPIWRKNTQVSNEFADVLDKMVQFHYVERYESVSELQNILKSFLFTEVDWCQKGESLVKTKNYNEAIIAFKEALSIQQDYPDAINGISWSLYYLRQYNKALAGFKKVLKIYPNNYQALTGCSWVFIKLGNYDEALASSERAIEIQSDYEKAWVSRGGTLIYLGYATEALTVFEQVLGMNPDNVDAWASHAWALIELGRNEEALASCEQAIQRDTDFADAWSNRGVALLKLGNYNEAIACCQRAIKINADEVIYFVNLAWVLYSCGRHDEALANYELELKIKPNDSKLWTYQGILLCELKKYQQADLSLKTAIKLDSNSALAHLYSGTVLFLSKSVAFEQLLELVEQAISIKQGLSNEHLVLAQLYKGICLSKLGKDEDAFATLNKLTNVRASDGLIYLVLYTCGEVLNKLRKYEEAIIYLDKSLTIQQNCEFAIKARKRAKKNLWKPLFLRRWESILMKYISLYSVSDLIILSPIAFIFLYFSPIIIAIPMLVILSISITLVKWSSPISRKP